MKMIEVGLPEFVDPKNRDYGSYADQLKQYNLSLQRRLGELLVKKVGSPNEERFCFLTTGSDGRLEKGPQSKIEIITCGVGDFEQRSRTVLQEVASKVGDIFAPKTEEKRMWGQEQVCTYAGNTGLVYPSRVLDSRFLYGSKFLASELKDQLSLELRSEFGKKIVDAVQSQRRRARGICETGRGRFKGSEMVHFDIDAGMAFYDNENTASGCRGSFKYGPLRLVQSGLTLGLVNGIRDGKLDLDFLANFPTNTVERLFHLEAEGRTALTHGEVQDLTDSYKFFLWSYHISQERYRNDRQKAVEFDREAIKKRMRDLVRIVSSKRILKT